MPTLRKPPDIGCADNRWVSVEHYENFPVASLLCPAALRPAVVAIYVFARTADDLADEGDAAPAQRLDDLRAFRNDLHTMVAGGEASARWPAVFGPLRAALMGERGEQFRALLAAGADPDLADRLGNTPLHVAGQINEPERALDLLNAGADPMARNAQGVTFQRYLFMTRAALLNAETRRSREAVEAWLTTHQIPLESAR